MTRTEFEAIKVRYDRETEQWGRLVVGQHVYVCNEWLDWFDHEIVAIDVDRRELICLDHSQGGVRVVIGCGFSTADELRARGYTLREAETHAS